MSLLIVFEGYQTGERQSVIPGTQLLRCQCTLFNLGLSNCTITLSCRKTCKASEIPAIPDLAEPGKPPRSPGNPGNRRKLIYFKALKALQVLSSPGRHEK